ncbi:hypothetical protein RRG08_042407 [Elysia crispata]|uniref:Secreted protein n=1 Tax=Elysia crispata TaxID=231223 RepID=A0AAE0ZBX7_9GAST|nr:hypothetical protein RRG08_042407 [Elysia crispata]
MSLVTSGLNITHRCLLLFLTAVSTCDVSSHFRLEHHPPLCDVSSHFRFEHHPPLSSAVSNGSHAMSLVTSGLNITHRCLLLFLTAVSTCDVSSHFRLTEPNNKGNVRPQLRGRWISDCR